VCLCLFLSLSLSNPISTVILLSCRAFLSLHNFPTFFPGRSQAEWPEVVATSAQIRQICAPIAFWPTPLFALSLTLSAISRPLTLILQNYHFKSCTIISFQSFCFLLLCEEREEIFNLTDHFQCSLTGSTHALLIHFDSLSKKWFQNRDQTFHFRSFLLHSPSHYSRTKSRHFSRALLYFRRMFSSS
jgi:hypothetical protein